MVQTKYFLYVMISYLLILSGNAAYYKFGDEFMPAGHVGLSWSAPVR